MCESCGKPKCNCGKDTCSTGAAVVIKNATEYTNFRKVLVPASVRSDETDPPKPGEFCNVLLVFEATGNVYLYSSDGVPTLISDFHVAKEIWDAIEAEKTAREEEDDRLNKLIEDETGKLDKAIKDEADTRSTADQEIWTEIEAIEASSDVVDVVGTYAELQAYDTSKLHDKDLIKVLQDETHDNAITYYRWSKQANAFTYVGAEGPYYTCSETDALLGGKQDKLVAGSNIQIASDGKTISATDTTYTAGANISISANNEISATLRPIYTSTGRNTDGGMTQRAITDTLFAQGYDPAAGVNDVRIAIGGTTLSPTTVQQTGGIAIGHGAKSNGWKSIAIGLSSENLDNGTGQIAIGRAKTQGGVSIAIGEGAEAKGGTYAGNALAIGGSAKVDLTSVNFPAGAVAIGSNSKTTEDLTVSVGQAPDSQSEGIYRRIINVADATTAHDAVTKSQLDAVASAMPTVNNATLTITQNGTSAGTFTANSSTDTTIALTDTTYSVFTGTDGITAGTTGLVPAPLAADAGKYLKADGTWETAAKLYQTTGQNTDGAVTQKLFTDTVGDIETILQTLNSGNGVQ